MELLILTGTMGAGKTTVLAEVSDILKLRQIPHAAIDVDALGLAHLPPATSSNQVMYNNLRSVCKNYAAVGVQRFLLARAIEDRAELELCREVTSATKTIVCRLTATVGTMQERVKRREQGLLQRKYAARVPELNSILHRAQLEDFIVANENRALTDVALEVLAKAGWISN